MSEETRCCDATAYVDEYEREVAFAECLREIQEQDFMSLHRCRQANASLDIQRAQSLVLLGLPWHRCKHVQLGGGYEVQSAEFYPPSDERELA